MLVDREVESKTEKSRTRTIAKFDIVCLDYFRFPGAYMRQHYTLPVLKEALPELLRQGLIDHNTQIYIPNLPNLIDKTGLINGSNVQWEGIEASKYPLFVATGLVAEVELDNHNNKGELKQLDVEHPFLQLSFRLAAATPTSRTPSSNSTSSSSIKRSRVDVITVDSDAKRTCRH